MTISGGFRRTPGESNQSWDECKRPKGTIQYAQGVVRVIKKGGHDFLVVVDTIKKRVGKEALWILVCTGHSVQHALHSGDFGELVDIDI